VGEDGATHHGVFDLAYLRCIPNLIIVAPRNEMELRNIMYTAQKGLQQPIAIRYPRGRGVTPDWKSAFESIEIGTGVQLEQGDNLAILSIGAISNTVSTAIEGLNCAHYDLRFVKPLDTRLLHTIFKTYSTLITIEDGVISGGFGSAILEFAAAHHYKNDVIVKGIPDVFIEQGPVDTLFETLELDSQHLKQFVFDLIQKKGTP
jgi:1-deoxy-D-xylulose-5-phosphate synthase